MTTKTSFFNKGIYKSAVKRNIWGSILYFILLSLFTTLPIILIYNPAEVKLLVRPYREFSILLSSDSMVYSLLLSMAVPTVTGLLVFRYMHSKKAAIFTNSLPVSREANFISSALAGYTLMALPVILNGFLLMLLSVCGYSAYFSVVECIMWVGINLFSLFIMFSCTCFASSLTGNSFAMVVLNVLVHTVLVIVASCVVFVAETFLYGLSFENSIVNVFADNTFPSVVVGMFENGALAVDDVVRCIVIPLVAAIVLYGISLMIFRIRRSETAGDVAGFKILNPVFKYLVTLIVALVTTVMISYDVNENPAIWIIVVITGVVAYFGTEMLLKKSFSVWKSYKGFLIATAVYVLFVVVISQTSFFGYETYIPDMKDVKKISVSDGYYIYGENEIPYFEDEKIIELGMEIHKELIEKRDNHRNSYDYPIIYIEYELENGEHFSRAYSVPYDEYDKIYEKMYTSIKYKKANEIILNDSADVLLVGFYNQGLEITDKAHCQEIFECLRKDVEKRSYSDLWEEDGMLEIDVTLLIPEDGRYVDHVYSINLSPEYKNTYACLKKLGYGEKLGIE